MATVDFQQRDGSASMLVDGRTLGLAIRPLGPVDATFYASEHNGGRLAAKLLFNVQAK